MIVSIQKGIGEIEIRLKLTMDRNGLPFLLKLKESTNEKVKDTVISDPEWSKKHWSAIKYNYSKVTFFKYHIINLILLDIITIWALWKWKIFYSI